MPIQEPTRPIDPKWFSHKLNMAAMRYKVAVSIQTGWIVWCNGPFLAGENSDITITRTSLIHFLNKNKFYIVGRAYRDGNQYSIMPCGRHTYQDRQMSVVCSRYKTINSR